MADVVRSKRLDIELLEEEPEFETSYLPNARAHQNDPGQASNPSSFTGVQRAKHSVGYRVFHRKDNGSFGPDQNIVHKNQTKSIKFLR